MGRHRSGAARAEAPLRQVATPRNWLRGRCVEQPMLSTKEIPLSVPEDRPGQVPEDRPGQVPEDRPGQVPEDRPGQVPEARTACPLGVGETHVGKNLFHASPEPGCPGRGRAGNNGATRNESGRAVRASGTFKALQRARNPPKARSLGVPEARTACPLGVGETHVGEKLFHERRADCPVLSDASAATRVIDW